MLIFTRRWGPVAIKYPTVPIGILARCSAPLVNQPRGHSGLLWFVRHGNSSLARTKNSRLPVVFLPTVPRVQCVYSFLFSIFFAPFFFPSIPFFLFIRSRGMMRDRSPSSVEKLAEFRGRVERAPFFRPSLFFVFQIRPISLPRMCLFTECFAILASAERGGSTMCLVSSFPRIYGRKESRGVKEGEGG